MSIPNTFSFIPLKETGMEMMVTRILKEESSLGGVVKGEVLHKEK